MLYTMRKIAMTLAFTLAMLGLFAQNDSEHLKFMGIPIDGSHEVFVKKLEEKGFETITIVDGTALLVGEFAGRQNCSLGILYLTDEDLVHAVVVFLPVQDSWSILESDYFRFKEMFTKKYGKPTECVETFDSFIQPTDDNSKMYELIMGRCKYIAYYETSEGLIWVSIAYNMELGACVSINYNDKENSEFKDSKAMEDI